MGMLEELMPARCVECSYETGAERGAVSDVPAQVRLDRQATWLLMPNPPGKHGRAPCAPVTDKVGSYAAAISGLGLNVEHRPAWD
jgi:hypothetical protein